MPTTYSVASRSEFLTALAQASGGDTIVMAQGNYGTVDVRDSTAMDLTFGSTLTIKSADADNPAVFSALTMENATNVTLDGIKFDYNFKAGDTIYQNAFIFRNCENLTLRNATFDGDVAEGVSEVDDGYGYGLGLSIRGSKGVVIEDSEFYGFWKGFFVFESQDITVQRNEIHSIRMDGMNFAEVQNLLVENNYIHDFRASVNSTDHQDMIQIWTANTDAPSTNIVIRGNILDIGTGSLTQSIFMRNERVDMGLSGAELFYQNVLIEDNVIVNGHANGISVGEVAGLIIRNNSVLHSDGGTPDAGDDSVEIPRINVAVTSTGVVITNNLTSLISGYSGQSTWTVESNAFAQDQDPLAANYYADMFISSSLQAVNGVHGFILLPGSLADQLGAGATGTAAPAADDLLAARFHVTSVAGKGATRIFDANFSDLGGLPAGSTVAWSFGDGSTATGVKVSHTYAQGGSMDVLLVITTPDGTASVAKMELGVEGPDVVSLTANGGFQAYHEGAPVYLGKPAVGSTEGLQLGGTTTVASVSRLHLRELPTTDEIDIAFSLKADTAGASGEVFRLHGSLSATVNAAGELVFGTTSKAGVTRTLTTSGAQLGNGAEHDVAIRMIDGVTTIMVDGVARGQISFTGPLAWNGFQDLIFGNPWGAKNFAGDLTAFNIRTNASDYPDTPQTVVLQAAPPAEPGAPTEQVLTGGTGDDSYIVNATNIRIDDEGGTDEVGSSLLSIDLNSTKLDGIENAHHSGAADLNITGDNAANLLTGNDGANVISGGEGNDTLVGGGGVDTLVGGAGTDTYVVSSVLDVIIDSGTTADTIKSAVSYTLGTGIESGILTGKAYALTGNAANNVLLGNASANLINGGGGNDYMKGGAGNDIYTVNSSGDSVVEISGGGYDTIRSSISLHLASYVEKGILTGKAASLTGNGGNNLLLGNDVANRIDGGAGADTMVGGKGNDTYIVNNTGDRITESAGGGYDTVRSSTSHRLGSGVEKGDLTGKAYALTGNSGNNLLLGNGVANRIDGGTGGDTMIGGAGNDTYIINSTGDRVSESAGGGSDTVRSSISYRLGSNIEHGDLTGKAYALTGNGGNNRLLGNDVANRIDGGAGADTMVGGKGNDTYIVNNTGDRISESAGGGYDTVKSAVSLRLAAFVDKGDLTGKAYALTGNGGDNRLLGNDVANLLTGGGGDDTMAGGKGNDTYIINGSTDRVIEAAKSGYDTIKSWVSTTLSHYVEKGVLLGKAYGLTGNGADNVLIGNAAANRLFGGGGADTLRGGDGNDIYLINSRGDRVIEYSKSGSDTVQTTLNYTLNTHIEKATLRGDASKLTGNALDNTLLGNAGRDWLFGNGGDDVIKGGSGHDILAGGRGGDTLTGGTGEDRFIFSTGGDRDVIRDFDARGTDHDILDIRNLTAVKSYKDLVDNHLHKLGDDVVIYAGSGDVIVLRDVTLSSLGANDFLI